MFVRHLFAYILPWLIVLIFWSGYSHYSLDLREWLKLTGLVAVLLVSLTFVVGPLARFWSGFNQLKVHRKYWGICSFIVMAAHVFLGLSTHYHYNISYAISTANPNQIGFLFGLFSFLYFSVMTVTSNRLSMQHMGKAWKEVQVGGYVALVLTLVHFVLLESGSGQFEIKRLLGRITFSFAVVVVVVRLWVWLWASADQDRDQTYLDIG